MNNKRRIILIFLAALLVAGIAHAQVYREHNSGEGWSGTIYYEVRSTHSSSLGKGFDEWIIEIQADNGKVTSKATNTFNKSGPECSNNISGSQATSQSIPKFSFSVKSENNRNYFTIDEGMPILKGSRTVCGKKENIWQDDLALYIDALEVGNDPDFISGDTTITTKTTNGQQTFVDVVKMSVSLTRGPIAVELIVYPGEYDSWLPLPSKDAHPGSTMNVAFKVQAKGGGKSLLKVKYFEVELQNTSAEPGIALNAPLNVTGSDPDLKLVSNGDNLVTDSGQKQRIQPADDYSGAAMIASFDGGGYTTLVIYAVLENNKRIAGELLKSGGVKEILIPKRNAGSKIADAWLIQFGNPADKADEDKSPGNQNHGDGLSAYEEYRGLFSEGHYIRLDPTKKELGVQVIDEADKKDFLKGFELFSQASGINIIRLDKMELLPTRVLNANKETAHLIDQHGIKILTGPLGEDVLGVNNPPARLVKTPRLSDEIIIDVNQARKQFIKQRDTFALAGVSMPYTSDENIAITVAHEIAHAVHADHHGDPSNEINRLLGFASSIPVRVYNTSGVDVSADTSVNRKGRIGVHPCEQSGDLSCIMAYTQAYQWAYKKTSEAFLYYAVPPLPLGNRFCTSATGTGINAGGKYFGNAKAERGNCLAQLKVKDN